MSLPVGEPGASPRVPPAPTYFFTSWRSFLMHLLELLVSVNPIRLMATLCVLIVLAVLTTSICVILQNSDVQRHLTDFLRQASNTSPPSLTLLETSKLWRALQPQTTEPPLVENFPAGRLSTSTTTTTVDEHQPFAEYSP